MSIADKIQRLETAKEAIATAITAKGGIVDGRDGFEEFADDISTIPKPAGKTTITENGENIDIAQYATADVSVPTRENDLVDVINRTIKEIDIPGGFSTIGDYAFYGCSSLESVNFYSGNQTIGDFAFYGCTSLDNIELPLVLRTVGSNAFSGCTGLESVIIQSNSLIEIGNNAFYGCTSLTDIYYTGTQAQWETITIGTGAIPQRVTIHYEYTPSE